jgi:hypothetical protein
LALVTHGIGASRLFYTAAQQARNCSHPGMAQEKGGAMAAMSRERGCESRTVAGRPNEA